MRGREQSKRRQLLDRHGRYYCAASGALQARPHRSKKVAELATRLRNRFGPDRWELVRISRSEQSGDFPALALPGAGTYSFPAFDTTLELVRASGFDDAFEALAS